MSLDVYLYDEKTYLENEENYFLYENNITHNLNKMADKAGIYKALWRPEEIYVTRAEDLIALLQNGLDKLKANPDKFKKYNSINGWGTYENLVKFVKDYLKACKKYPLSIVKVSR